MRLSNITPEKLIEKVRAGHLERNEVIKFLYSYDSLNAKVEKYLLQNGGQKSDKEGFLIDGIVKFIQSCYKPYFKINSSVEAYILTIVKNDWILSQRKKNKEIALDTPDITISNEELFVTNEIKENLNRVIAQLDEKCRKIILMWSQNIKMREIAVSMNYKSDGMARKKKFQCMAKLKDLIEKNNLVL